MYRIPQASQGAVDGASTQRHPIAEEEEENPDVTTLTEPTAVEPATTTQATTMAEEEAIRASATTRTTTLDTDVEAALPAYIVGEQPQQQDQQPQNTPKNEAQHEVLSDENVQTFQDVRKLSTNAKLLVGLVVFLLVAGIVGMAVGFTQGSKNAVAVNAQEDQNDRTPSQAPTVSTAPSLVPTDYPTMEGFEVVAQDVLKNFGSNTHKRLQEYYSPQAKAARWIGQEDVWFTFPLGDDAALNNHFRQRYALAVFFYSTGGEDSWIDHVNFLSSLHECEWKNTFIIHRGVRCDLFDNVIEVNINDNNLTNAIPEEIWGLESLQNLVLFSNILTGSLPNGFYKLTNLQALQMPYNPVSGTLSSLIGNMESLGILWFQDSQLSGTLPTEMGLLTNMVAISITGSNIAGTVPDEISNWPWLSTFLIGESQLTGTIPSWIGNATNLQQRNVFDNQLVGTIPDGLYPSLILFAVGKNDLSGSIPSSILTPTLTHLTAAENRLSSSLPQDCSHMTDLAIVSLMYNRLTGTIPDCFGQLSTLQFFDVSFNDIGGPLIDLANSSQSLFSLGVDANPRVSGTIPSSYNSMSSLSYFSVANTSLTGDLTTICEVGSQPIVSGNCDMPCPCCSYCVDEDGEIFLEPEE